MSSTTERQQPSSEPSTPSRSFLQRLWFRQLDTYPDTGPRVWYLGIVVAVSVVLYYELYIQYAVTTELMPRFDMTYRFVTMISVVGNLVGAFASLLAGLADRWGRANITVYGVLLTGLLTLFAVPNAHSKWQLMFYIAVVSMVEGAVLVATPALIRDFSPQVGRASAMGFWTLGPVLGSLAVTEVSSHTLSHHGWQDQFRFSGYAGLGIFVIALFGLRELSPRLRDQIMVTMRDRALVEARARGLDPDAALKGQWRQMMRLDIVGSALGISLHLMLYYTIVGNLVVMYASVFGYDDQRTNALANWYWIANGIALVVVGVVSDRLRVRKPFMIVGGTGTVVLTTVYVMKLHDTSTGYYTFAWLLVGIGAFSGLTYAPWMASFTETVERRNPAATATGLAVWGWIIRVVVSVSAALTPVVVTSATPLVNDGPKVQAAQAAAGPAVGIFQQHEQILRQLAAYPDPTKAPPDLIAKAVSEVGMANLLTVQKAQPQLEILDKYAPGVLSAQKRAPDEWRRWGWVTVVCQLLFLPCVFIMAGRWRPKKAREDEAEHERRVAEELARMHAAAA